MAIGAAGVNAKREAMALGRRIDRPKMTAPERRFAHRQYQDLHEAGILPVPAAARRPASVLDRLEEGPEGQYALL